MGDLALGGLEVGLLGDGLEGVEQDGLSHAPEASDQKALLGPTDPQPCEEDPECLQLDVTTGEGRRTGAGARGVRVADGVDGSPDYSVLFTVYPRWLN